MNAATASDRDEFELTALGFTETTAKVTPCSRTSAASKLLLTSLVLGQLAKVVALDVIVVGSQVSDPIDRDGVHGLTFLGFPIAGVHRDEGFALSNRRYD